MRDIPGVLGGSRLLEQPRYQAEVAAWQAFLERRGPLLVEIGFDHGRRLSQTAARHPGWRVAGLEVRRQRVEQARERASRDGLANLFAWRVDARAVLANHTPEACVDVVEALFPDPWWVPAHRERRLLVTPEFLDDVARVLAPQGVLHLATDVAPYAEHIDACLARDPAWVVEEGLATRRPGIEALSRREWTCARQGITVYRWWARRRSAGGSHAG